MICSILKTEVPTSNLSSVFHYKRFNFISIGTIVYQQTTGSILSMYLSFKHQRMHGLVFCRST